LQGLDKSGEALRDQPCGDSMARSIVRAARRQIEYRTDNEGNSAQDTKRYPEHKHFDVMTKQVTSGNSENQANYDCYIRHYFYAFAFLIMVLRSFYRGGCSSKQPY
jgi:hypothetical protein